MRQTFQFACLDIPPIMNTPNVGPVTAPMNVVAIWKNNDNSFYSEHVEVVHVFRDF